MTRTARTMGELIRFLGRTEAQRPAGDARHWRAPGTRTTAEFFFDLGCPFTYLAAEHLERTFDELVWTPACAATMRRAALCAEGAGAAALRHAAERRAVLLRLPLVWPERWPMDVRRAMRVASWAVEAGRGAEFVLASSRLAFCGGFELDDPEILAEATAAAGLGLDDCLRAARDGSRDGPIEAAGRRLLAIGADRLPAVRVGRALYWGEPGVRHAVAGARVERAAQR